MGRLFIERCLLFQLFPKSGQPQTCVQFGVWTLLSTFLFPFGLVTVNWLIGYVRICELLLLLQDTVTPAVGAAPPAAEATSSNTAAEVVTPAAEGAKEAVQNAANAASDAPPPWMQFLPFIAIGLFFYFILLRPQQAEQRRRKELLNQLKKNDKVVTTGGMIGTIADISSDGSRVTLKVDDNTRIKFLRSAILEPLKDTPDSSTSGTT